jgi:hypothetical protein
MPSRVITVTIEIQQDSQTGSWSAKSADANPDKLKIQLGQGVWTITYNLVLKRGAPASAQLWFARDENGWGNENPVTFKQLTEGEVAFPGGWTEAQKQAFLTAAQTALNGITSGSSDSNRAQAVLSFDPGTLESGQTLEIHLPYTIEYFINVDTVSWGPIAFDPEVDIEGGT